MPRRPAHVDHKNLFDGFDEFTTGPEVTAACLTCHEVVNNVGPHKVHAFANCVGCHEQRTDTPPAAVALDALARGPSRIEPFEDVPDVLDFPRDVQPILDRHCLGCHYDWPIGRLSLGFRTWGLPTCSSTSISSSLSE